MRSIHQEALYYL